MKALLGLKQAQTQTFTEDGKRIPVTDVLTDVVVVQIKTQDTDGYFAIQLGIGAKSPKHTTKPLLGHLKKTGQGNKLPRFLREVKVATADEIKDLKVGDAIAIDQVFQVGDRVSVVGISKAKGFAGGVKRHGFAGGPRTHGQSDRERAPGSIGQTTTPGRVYKGKRMAGHMGGEQVTVAGLKIIAINNDSHIVRVKGLIPGRVNTPILIEKQI